jgi:hypothetical protein
MSRESGYQTPVTVTCPDHRAVHLAVPAVAGGPLSRTLCGELVESTRPALNFLHDGCLDCALTALGLGLTTATDSGRAAVSIPRFVADRDGS